MLVVEKTADEALTRAQGVRESHGDVCQDEAEQDDTRTAVRKGHRRGDRQMKMGMGNLAGGHQGAGYDQIVALWGT